MTVLPSWPGQRRARPVARPEVERRQPDALIQRSGEAELGNLERAELLRGSMEPPPPAAVRPDRERGSVVVGATVVVVVEVVDGATVVVVVDVVVVVEVAAMATGGAVGARPPARNSGVSSAPPQPASRLKARERATGAWPRVRQCVTRFREGSDDAGGRPASATHAGTPIPR